MKLKPTTIVKQSKSHGLGVFSLKPFAAKQLIAPILGNPVHWKTLLKIGGLIQSNAIRLSLDYYLSPSGLGNYLNHSCSPNAKIVIKNNRMFLYSLTKIQKGDELMFDYSTTIGDDDIWKMKCSCKLRECRKIIRNFGSLPQLLIKQYIQNQAVPKVIQETQQK